MRLSLLLAASVAALSLAGCGAKMSDAEFAAKAKDWVMKNPQVVLDAVDAYNRKAGEDADAKTKVAADKLYNDTLKPQLAKQVLDPTIGPANAKVTIVQYTDYNCPFCQVANAWVFKQADDPRKDVRIVFKEMPIPSIPGHESSPDGSRAALAADRQGKYREMHNALMKAKRVTPEAIEKAAKDNGINYAKLIADMKGPEVNARMEQIAAEQEIGQLNGTPTFFINGQVLRGWSEEQLDKMVDDARRS
jgi:protein-disulfide isomerase